MIHYDIVQAINSIRPGAKWLLRGDDLVGLEWLDTEQERPTDDEIVAKVAELSEAPPTPNSASPRQIRLALSQMGLRQQVEDYVNSQSLDVQDSWHYSTQFDRTHPLILACQQALGKTDEELDALFFLASSFA